MAELVIREAAASDLVAVMTLLARCIEAMRQRGIDQWDDVYPTEERFKSDVSAGSLYVASMDTNEVVGAFTLDERQDPAYALVPWSIPEVRVAVVHRLMVDPPLQGRGIARQLMRFAESLARKQGCGVMRLDAFAQNPKALALYKALGYREAGEVKFRKGAFRCFERRLDTSVADLRAT